jgi:DNA-binding winged helix-turn-helix (wHTH) protein
MADALDALPLSEQVEHLKFMLAEMLEPADECAAFPGVTLRQSSARLLNLLYRRAPKTVPHSAIYAALTWDRIGREPSDDIVKQQAHYTRVQLRAAGIPIPFEAVLRFGYRWISDLPHSAACADGVETAAPSSFGPADTDRRDVPPRPAGLFP